MAYSKFKKMLRAIVQEFYKGEGNIDSDAEHFGGYKLDKNTKIVYTKLVSLVMETSYFNKEVKAYLKGESLKSISARKYVNENTMKSKINYQIGRLERELGQDALGDMLRRPEKGLLKKYMQIITGIYNEYQSRSMLENVDLKLPKYDGRIVTSLDDEDMECLFILVRENCKNARRAHERCFTLDMVGYVHYLENQKRNGALSETEKEHYDLLYTLLEE